METKSIFDLSWDATDEDFAEEKKQSVKHKIVRQFETSYDYATDEIIKLKEAQAVMLKNKMQNFDLNKYRENVSAIEDLEKAQEDVKKRYVEFFGEEMKR